MNVKDNEDMSMERHFEMATERKYKLLWKQYLNILGCLITREKTIQTKVYNTCKNKITYQWIIRWQRVFWKILLEDTGIFNCKSN